ncbi:MAG: hypothetical protein AAFR13_08770, partial [Pseudomonadota bacterium]
GDCERQLAMEDTAMAAFEGRTLRFRIALFFALIGIAAFAGTAIAIAWLAMRLGEGGHGCILHCQLPFAVSSRRARSGLTIVNSVACFVGFSTGSLG